MIPGAEWFRPPASLGMGTVGAVEMATIARRRTRKTSGRKRVLVIDVGGTHVKMLATGHTVPRAFRSEPSLTPAKLVARVKRSIADWRHDVVTVGFPGPVAAGRPVAEPLHLGCGWVGFDFSLAFGCPARVMNDAAMQALGSYAGGKMLFLGLGTGLGSAMVVDGIVEPMELAHLPFRKHTFEDYVGVRAFKAHGKRRWRKYVTEVVRRLAAALEPDEVVLGGGNVKHMKQLPERCRAGSNDLAFVGGYRAWGQERWRPVRTTASARARRDGGEVCR